MGDLNEPWCPPDSLRSSFMVLFKAKFYIIDNEMA